MRTAIYVDGFNLYYGAVRGTPFKWLNLKALFSKVLKPANVICSIKYFTALVSSTAGDPQKDSRQKAYLRALQVHIPEIEIHYGHFLSHEVTAPLARPLPGKAFEKIIKTEEKGSDVNLAVHLLNDAWLGLFDCAVVVSNDSDLAEAMRLVKLHHPGKIIVTILRSPDLDPVFVSLYFNYFNSLAGQLQVEMHQRGTSGQLELYPFDIRRFLIWSAPQGLQKELRSLHDRAAAARRKSKELLDQARSRVEQLIEEAVRS